MNRNFRFPENIIWRTSRVAAVGFLAFLAVTGISRLYAQVWPGPIAPPLSISQLSSILNLDDLVSTSDPSEQKVSSGVAFGSDVGMRGAGGAAYTNRIITMAGESASVAYRTAVTVTGSGLPVVAYASLVGGKARLYVASCSDTSCSSATRYEIDPETDVGTGYVVAMETASDGTPTIAYLFTSADASINGIRVATCVVEDCSSVRVQTVYQVSSASESVKYISMAVGASGKPVLAYTSAPAGDPTKQSVYVIECARADCAGEPGGRGTRIVEGSAGAGVDGAISLAIGSDDMPIIAFAKQPVDYLKTVKCTVASCASFGPEVTVDNTGLVDVHLALAISPADGFPSMSYAARDSFSGVLELFAVHCLNRDCSQKSVAAEIDASQCDCGFETDIVVSPQGRPIISYYAQQAAGGVREFRIAACETASCTSEVVTTLDKNGEYVGRYSALDATPAGRVIASYIHDDTLAGIHDVQLAFCGSESCSNSGGARAAVAGDGVTVTGAGYVSPLPLGLASGVVGSADGGQKNFGVLSVTDSGIAIWARAEDTKSYAGYFLGAMNIENSPYAPAAGSLTSDGLVSSAGAVSASALSGYALALSQSKPPQGIAVSAIASGAGIGIHGFSTASSGVVATSTDDTAAIDAISSTGYGAYGYSPAGTGVIGEVSGGADTAIGVLGKAYDKGVYGRSGFNVSGYEFKVGEAIGNPKTITSGLGVYACGSEYAASFAGSVRTTGSFGMGYESETYIENNQNVIIGRELVADLILDEASLSSLYTLCQARGICTTPVPSLGGGKPVIIGEE